MKKQTKTSNENWSLAGLSLVPLVMVLGNSMLIPVLPDIKSELHISQFQTSLIITAFSIPAAIIIPVTGYLADHYGRKKVMIPALIIYAIGGLIAGLAAALLKENSYTLIMVGRILQGMGAAGTAPLAMTLASDIFNDAKRSSALGVIEAFNGIGKVVSPILGSLVALIVWYATFFVFPLLCIPIALFVWFAVQEPAGNLNKQPVKAYVQTIYNVFKTRGISLLASFLAGAMTLFILFGLLFFLSDILENKFQIDGIYKGFVIAIPLLVMATTSYITGNRVKSKINKMKRLIVLGLIILTIASSIAAITSNIYWQIALLCCIGLGSGLVLPCLNTLITGSISAQERGLITSLYGSVRFIGVAIGPPIFGFLMKISQSVMYLTMSALAAITVIIVYYAIRSKKSTAAMK